jgi:heterodisulfide reductase subunit B
MASQEAVEPLGYLYFPGCSLKGTGVAYEESFLTLFRLLGLPLQELPDWNCCGATSYMAICEGTAFVLAARNLALAQQLGAMELVAPCSACYLVLRKTLDYTQKYPEVRRQVQEAMTRAGLPFPNAVRVRHPLEVLFTDVGEARVAAAVRRRWSGGRVACYYGCQVVRPYAEVDEAYAPTRMDELLAAAGIPTVDYPLKTRCCGGSLTATMTEVGTELNGMLLEEAKRRGAEAIVTICPLCQFNLDIRQREINARTGAAFDIPILLLPQILGWVFGGDRRALGLHRVVSGRRALDEWLAPGEEPDAHGHR